MNRRVTIGLLFTLALASCTGAPSEGPILAGEWSPAKAQLSGVDFPVSNFGGVNLKLTSDTYDFAGDKGTYTLLGTEVPAKMDIVGEEGPNAGRAIPAIYTLNGTELTICYQLGTGERPTEFISPLGSKVLLVTYKQAP